MEESENAVIEYNDEVKRQLLIQVYELQTADHLSVAQACEQVGISSRTFYYWIGQGLLSDYLESLRESRVKHIQMQAASAMPDVVAHMIAIATGEVEVRGASPVAAAKWLAQISAMEQIAAKDDSEEDEHESVPLLEIQHAIFNIVNGRPQLDSQGRLTTTNEIIVEAEDA